MCIHLRMLRFNISVTLRKKRLKNHVRIFDTHKIYITITRHRTAFSLNANYKPQISQ